MKRIILLLIALVFVLAAGPASAHNPQLTGIRFIQRAHDVLIAVDGHLSRLSAAEGWSGANPTTSSVEKAIEHRLKIVINGQPYVPQHVHVIVDRQSDMMARQGTYTGVFKNVQVQSRLYPEDEFSQTLVSFIDDGLLTSEVMLDKSHPSMGKGGNANPDQGRMSVVGVISQFVKMGVVHILTGPDHILFVLGLLLLGGSLISLVKTVTPFTAAHTLTLGLTAFGVIHPQERIVEPLIALSIAAIGVENIYHLVKRSKATEGTAKDHRPLIAFGFGLIHGMGFASALTSLHMTGTLLIWGLGSFNLGVEIGQILIIIAAYPAILWVMKRRPVSWQRLAIGGSWVVSMVGGTWCFGRVFLHWTF